MTKGAEMIGAFRRFEERSRSLRAVVLVRAAKVVAPGLLLLRPEAVLLVVGDVPLGDVRGRAGHDDAFAQFLHETPLLVVRVTPNAGDRSALACLDQATGGIVAMDPRRSRRILVRSDSTALVI